MTRFIVVLGTTSHSGKGTIVSALCRILKNRGLAVVAPFKSQNMSLNSWVTFERKDMGIAQAVQAWARGRAEGTDDPDPPQAEV